MGDPYVFPRFVKNEGDLYVFRPLCFSFTIEAGHLVSEYFSAPERLGMIRLRESPYCRPDLQIEKFMSVLQELFPVGTEPSHRQ
jgi:hypothetical protein